jgi:dTDP-4-dehydrorhamnose reductase
MRILLTGATGFLGYYLAQQLLQAGHEVVGTGRQSADDTLDADPHFRFVSTDLVSPAEIRSLFSFQPEMVIHTAAMTKPDDCEREKETAFAVNVTATKDLLVNAQKAGALFIYLSTDFVFDGIKGMYTEEDIPSPVNYYGQTKLEAERAVMQYEYPWAIARTVLLYGRSVRPRQQLLTIVREKLERGESYNVVDDQWRTPTYIEDLARGILAIVEKQARGIYHISGAEYITPFQMAVRAADHLGLDSSLLNRVDASTFKEPARRPLRTGFNIEKARTKLGFEPIGLDEGIRKMFRD